MILLLYAMAVSYFGGAESAPVALAATEDVGERPTPTGNHSLGGPESWEREWDLYSPRVMLATEPPGVPPLLFIMEASLAQAEVANRTARSRRQAAAGGDGRTGGDQIKPARRGELSVCDSVNSWVIDKRTAVDITGRAVGVLAEVPTPKGPMKQFFYETKCNNSTSTARSGCRGVDRRHWVSECKTKQSFVRALTVDYRKQTGWRWIRIDTACVCALNNRTTRT